MKGLISLVIALLLCFTASAQLGPPNQGVNATCLWDATPGTNIAGYKLYQGPAPRFYTNVVDVGNVTSHLIRNLKLGVTYYFAVTAYDRIGLESDFSNEADYTTPSRPAPPGVFRIPPDSTTVVTNITQVSFNGIEGPWEDYAYHPLLIPEDSPLLLVRSYITRPQALSP